LRFSSCARIWATLRVLAVDLGAEALLHLRLAGDRLPLAGARLRFGASRGSELLSEIGEVRLRLLEIELRAGTRRRRARGTERRAFAQSSILAEISADLAPACSIAPFVSGDLGLRALVGLLDFLLLSHRVRELRLQRVDLQLIRGRVDPEQHVTLLDRAVALLDRDLDHAAANLRDDRHGETVDAQIGGRRRDDVEREDHHRQATIGMMTTVTCE
jgi:hypothetical protein